MAAALFKIPEESGRGFAKALARGHDVDTAIQLAGFQGLAATSDIIPIARVLGRFQNLAKGRLGAKAAEILASGLEGGAQGAIKTLANELAKAGIIREDPDSGLIYEAGSAAAAKGFTKAALLATLGAVFGVTLKRVRRGPAQDDLAGSGKIR